MKKKEMTLVELLIVISVIAVLAGLLFPVLTSVRERARIVYCINNLKQIGATLHMYAQDHDGFVPPYTNNVHLLTPSFPEEIKALLLPNASNPELLKAAYISYTKNWQIWYCLLDPYAGYSYPIWTEEIPLNHGATSYKIYKEYAIKGIVPVHISSPPPIVDILPKGKRQWVVRIRKNEFRIWYASDFYHPNYYVETDKFIRLYLDGTVKVEKEAEVILP